MQKFTPYPKDESLERIAKALEEIVVMMRDKEELRKKKEVERRIEGFADRSY